MLRNVQAYIAQNGTVSVADLSLHFQVDGAALQPMLHKLSRKGRIRQLPTAAKCCGCTACDRDTLELYEWVETSTAHHPGRSSKGAHLAELSL